MFIRHAIDEFTEGHRVPYIMSCFGNTFLQYSQAVGGKLWYWVSLFGTPEEAQRYKVTMSLVARNRVSCRSVINILVMTSSDVDATFLSFKGSEVLLDRSSSFCSSFWR